VLRALRFIAFSILLATRSPAQVSFGSIIGTVLDPAGGRVPNTRVRIVSLDRGHTFRTRSNEHGNYAGLDLRPGPYRVEIQANGFQTCVFSPVMVGVDRATRVDAVLPVGAYSETATVTTEAPPLVTDRAEIGLSLTPNAIRRLPILNRNITNLFALIPGAQRATQQIAGSENPQEAILTNFNGQDAGSLNFIMDGVDDNDPVLGLIVINPSLESIAEMKVATANFDAEFARAGGAVIQVETRAGANEFHGGVFEYLQNDVFRARNPFSEPHGPPPLRWNQFGGGLAGPVRRNKIFFFGDYQGARQRTGASLLTTVPGPQVRRGDLQLFDAPVFDFMTGDATGHGRAPFPENILPSSRLSAPALALLGRLPSPNAGAPADTSGNFIASASERFDAGQYTGRVDFAPDERWRIFARYTIARFDRDSPSAFGPASGGPALSGLQFAGTSRSVNQSLALNGGYVASPSLVADFRFGFLRYRVHVAAPETDRTAATELGIPGIVTPGREDTMGMPSFLVRGTGGFALGFGLPVNNCNCPLQERGLLYQGAGNWTRAKGDHLIKWGAEAQYRRNLRVASDVARNGVFTFSPSVTASADVPGSGLGLAAFLLGAPSGFSRFAEKSAEPEDAQWYSGFYVQDAWRATRALTVTAGLRWDTWFPTYSVRAGDGGRYDVSLNQILTAGVGGIPKNAGVRTRWGNLSPRLGIAFAPATHIVLRAGYGRSYFQPPFAHTFNQTANNYPTSVTQSLAQSSLFVPLFPLAEGPPPLVFPVVPADGRLALPDGLAATYRPADVKYPYTDSWNLSVETLLGASTTLSISYVGDVGRRQRMLRPLNQAIPGPGPLNPRRPLFQRFGLTQSITERSDGGNNSYNALQTKVARSVSSNLFLFASYTFGKTINNANGLLLNDGLNRGLADFDRKHVAAIGHSWMLPSGPEKRFLRNGLAAKLAGGWAFHGITTLASGLPLNPYLVNNASLNADANLRPDVVPGADPYEVSGGQTREHWFSPAAYRIPAPYRFGNAGRNSLRGPLLISVDWALSKTFPIRNHARFTFRWEVFNAFNLTRLANPDGAVDAGPTVVGRIVSLTAPMRQQQLAAQIEF